MSKTLKERLITARSALTKLENYWLEKMNKALEDQRKIVRELEDEYRNKR